MKEKIVTFLNKNKKYLILLVFVVLICGFFMIYNYFSNRLDEQWITEKITISNSDGAIIHVTDEQMVERISKLCNDGVFREVEESDRLQGNCEIWIDFNNGTVIGMYLNKDYGYLGDDKQYIGEPKYLPSGLNEFIKNIINNNVETYSFSGEITEIQKLGYILHLDSGVKNEFGTDTVYVCFENMPFNDIKDLDFEVGDTIKVTYNGEFIETYPLQVFSTHLELISKKQEKIDEDLIEMKQVLDNEEGYESKYQQREKDEDTYENFLYMNTIIDIPDNAIDYDNIPDWVEQEAGIYNLYSLGTIDYLLDVTAIDKFEKLTNSNWTESQRNNMYLGQGIKCYNFDIENSTYYYPVILNGHIISLMSLIDINGDFEAEFDFQLINMFERIYSLTSESEPFILIKKDNILGALIDDVIYSEETIMLHEYLGEITDVPVVNVFNKLSPTEIETEEEVEVAEIENNATHVMTNGPTSLYESNDEMSNRITTLESGIQLERVSEENGWTKVIYEGLECYVLTQNVSNINLD